MFSLLVRSGEWSGRRDEMWGDRVYIGQAAFPAFYDAQGVLDLHAVARLPALFVSETDHRRGAQFAMVGTIRSISRRGRDFTIEYHFEQNVAPIPQAELIRLCPALGIPLPTRGIGPLNHSHWQVHEADLYKVLATEGNQSTRRPSVFRLNDPQLVEDDLISAMMPFAGFGAVYEAIRNAAINNNMRCHRADDIWENHAIIQDVIDLIDKSSIVICDCSGRNPNVFYEIGIAHTLGKEVILITQSGADVPFDLAHIRHLRYYPNDLVQLTADLSHRIDNLRRR